MNYRQMWAKRAVAGPWEFFVTFNSKFYIDGTECDPFDFWEIHRTAYQVCDVRVTEEDT